MEEFVQLKNKLWSVLLAVGGPLALGRGAIRQDDIAGYNGGGPVLFSVIATPISFILMCSVKDQK